jgi:hypothetical protein
VKLEGNTNNNAQEQLGSNVEMAAGNISYITIKVNLLAA